MELPRDWQQLLEQQVNSDRHAQLTEYVRRERLQFPDAVFPPNGEVYMAFQLTAVEKVKVVILGQDPYPTRGNAHGLAFSVSPDIRPIPASLRNIFKELVNDLGIEMPNSGSLIPWAKQGVLLLNTVLTVREGCANSHQKRGWEEFSDRVIQELSRRTTPIVFVLWGKPAQKKRALIDASRHEIVEAPHPSPLSAHSGFFGSRPFSKVNEALLAMGHSPINWRL